MKRRRLRSLIGLAGLALVACSTREMDRYFDSGQYARVTGAFEADPSLESDERALFQAGVAYAVPTSAVHDPERARELLGRLLQLYPNTTYQDQATWLDDLLGLEEELRRQVQQLEGEIEDLKAIDLGLPEEPTPDR